ncbi:transposase [Deinococcus oregonensis]|uniref:Transposase n=1 Tax=Deinococcus oregonensis TaxID=1805970 RepID=A0ABV6B4G1_9DEIO
MRLANEPDQSFVQVAKNLGISGPWLHRWARKLSSQGQMAFPGHGKVGLTTEQSEMKRLQRELDIARQERDVLKKAVACLGQNGRA